MVVKERIQTEIKKLGEIEQTALKISAIAMVITLIGIGAQNSGVLPNTWSVTVAVATAAACVPAGLLFAILPSFIRQLRADLTNQSPNS